jgi:hypothetical protein
MPRKQKTTTSHGLSRPNRVLPQARRLHPITLHGPVSWTLTPLQLLINHCEAGVHRPVNNLTTAVPATASTTRPRTTKDKDTTEFDTPPKTLPRDGQVSASIGVRVLVASRVAFRL